MAHWAIDYIIFPLLLLPLLSAWILIATIASFFVPLLVFPGLVLIRWLRWAVPVYGPALWRGRGWWGTFQRFGFEYSYTMNFARRFLSLPLRPYTPHFYILSFPKCGTTTLASYMMQHPGISGLDGMPWHPLLSKESHFFNGILGPKNAASPTLYRSFFPTVLTRWWIERVRMAGPWRCFDACPLTGCLPYTSKRIAAINPNAKLIFVVRNPIDAAFSAEMMLRNLGQPLEWSFMEDVVAADPRFAESPDDGRFWSTLEELTPEDPLPMDLPARLYGRCSSVLRCAQYAERARPFFDQFPRKNIMFVEFGDLISKPEETVTQVMQFVGVDAAKNRFHEIAVHSGDHRGRRMHPAVRRKLQHYFAVPNQRLFALLGRDFSWSDEIAVDEEQGGGMAASLPVLRSDSTRMRVQPVRLMPGRGVSLGRKDSGLVKRVFSVNASSKA